MARLDRNQATGRAARRARRTEHDSLTEIRIVDEKVGDLAAPSPPGAVELVAPTLVDRALPGALQHKCPRGGRRGGVSRQREHDPD